MRQCVPADRGRCPLRRSRKIDNLSALISRPFPGDRIPREYLLAPRRRLRACWLWPSRRRRSPRTCRSPRPASATGNYLAGQQAMSELRTPDAARFFRDAAADRLGQSAGPRAAPSSPSPPTARSTTPPTPPGTCSSSSPSNPTRQARRRHRGGEAAPLRRRDRATSTSSAPTPSRASPARSSRPGR